MYVHNETFQDLRIKIEAAPVWKCLRAGRMETAPETNKQPVRCFLSTKDHQFRLRGDESRTSSQQNFSRSLKKNSSPISDRNSPPRREHRRRA